MPQLLFDTRKEAMRQTSAEFAPWMAKLHHFVLLPSGRWCRTFGAPKPVGIDSTGPRTWKVRS